MTSPTDRLKNSLIQIGRYSPNGASRSRPIQSAVTLAPSGTTRSIHRVSRPIPTLLLAPPSGCKARERNASESEELILSCRVLKRYDDPEHGE